MFGKMIYDVRQIESDIDFMKKRYGKVQVTEQLDLDTFMVNEGCNQRSLTEAICYDYKRFII